MTIRTKKHLSIITTVSLAIFSLAYTTLSYLPGNIQSTQAYSYSSGYIDVVHGIRETPEEPSGSTADVTVGGVGNNFISPNCGGGYNTQNDNFVKKLNSSTDSYYFDLNLPTGTYEVDITARYGQMDAGCMNYINESGETLKITIDGESKTFNDPGNDFAWMQYTHITSGYTVTNDNEGPVRIEVEGTGTGTVEFGAIRIYGETHEVTNATPELRNFSYSDCEEFSFRVYDEDIANMTGTRPQYHINLYADNDGYPTGTGNANQIGQTISGNYNNNGYSDTITINLADYPGIFNEYRPYSIIVWAADYDSDGVRIDDDLNGWVLIGEEDIDLTTCAPAVTELTLEKKVEGINADTTATAYHATDGETLSYTIDVNAPTDNTKPLDVTLTDNVYTLEHIVNIRNTRLRVSGTVQASDFSITNIPQFTLHPGQTAVVSYDATVDIEPGSPEIEEVNVARANSPDTKPIADEAHVIIAPFECEPTISIEKLVEGIPADTAETAYQATDGETLDYTVNVSAGGDFIMPIDVTITDNISTLTHVTNPRNTRLEVNGALFGGCPSSVM